jgi:hypothetical protein
MIVEPATAVRSLVVIHHANQRYFVGSWAEPIGSSLRGDSRNRCGGELRSCQNHGIFRQLNSGIEQKWKRKLFVSPPWHSNRVDFQKKRFLEFNVF